jgi:hypothetical protein
MPTIFTSYVEKNFLSIHKNFTDLKASFDAGQDEDYGRKLNQVFKLIFGTRTIT